jgi:hypothetical protein
VFIEEIINQFRACHARENYTFVDVPTFLLGVLRKSIRSPADASRGGVSTSLARDHELLIRDELLKVSGFQPFLEVAGKYINAAVREYPNYVEQMASAFKALEIPTYSASPWTPKGPTTAFQLNRRFIELSGIHVCTSWCSDQLYEGFVLGEWRSNEEYIALLAGSHTPHLD